MIKRVMDVQGCEQTMMTLLSCPEQAFRRWVIHTLAFDETGKQLYKEQSEQEANGSENAQTDSNATVA